MEKKKATPLPSSSSEESSSGEEDGNEQEFVRSDRNVEDKKAQQVGEDSESEEEEEDENDDDHDDNEIVGTQRARSDEASSSEEKPPSHGEGDSDSDSETSSASDGKPSKSSHQFVVLPRKADNANGHNGMKAPRSEMSTKSEHKPQASPKKGKDKASKRDRDEPSVPEKSSTKKQKKESFDISEKNVEHLPKAKDSVKVIKDKHILASASEKKSDSKKSAHATTVAEKPEHVSTQQNSAKKAEGTSAKKVVQKGKNDKKSVKNADIEHAKGSLSPVKPKLFTGKDEIVLTAEILRDLQKGVEIPSKKSDGYWSELADRVEESMEGSWSKEQLCEKLKRMKNRYTSMVEKFNNTGERKFRNLVDQELFSMWDQIWGSGDTMNEDDTDDVKNKQSKALAATNPVKGGKASRNKVATPVQDLKIVMEESEMHKDDGDTSESEESNGGSDSSKKKGIVTSMEVDPKDAHADHILVSENNADNTLLHSVSEAQELFHEEVRSTLAAIQETSRQTLKDWQTKALAVIENAVKVVADKTRIMSGFGKGGFDGLHTPLGSLDMGDLQVFEGGQPLHQQWHELRLKELDVYRQRLELLQRECQLKQDQMQMQLHKKK